MPIFSLPFDLPVYHSFHPSQLLNQHFAVDLEPNDVIATFPIANDARYLIHPPTGYYRTWSSLASQNDTGSTVNLGGDKFAVNLDVQQFAPNEIKVKTSDDGLITVEGKHEEKEDEHGFISRQFARKYVIPKGYDCKGVTSTLSSDGVLTITAPKVVGKANDSRSVRVKQTGKPVKNNKSVVKSKL